MMISDCVRLECVRDPPLHRDCFHHALVHVLSVAVLHSDQMTLFCALFRSMPPINTHT